MTSPVICWFRRDLRLSDNPALHTAATSGRPVIALYVLDENDRNGRPLGAASRWWLQGSLTALARDLERLGVSLTLRRGAADAVLDEILTETGAQAVFWNRLYTPNEIARDERIKSNLKSRGVSAESFNGTLLYEPWQVSTQAGKPYFVFSPFWKAERNLDRVPAPRPAPESLPAFKGELESDQLDDWALLPATPDWAGGLREMWQPGERGAQSRLESFLQSTIATYGQDRDLPDRAGSSRLSPHLAFGEISARQVWHVTHDFVRRTAATELEEGCWSFLRELGWRDFNYNLLFHRPEMPQRNLKQDFDMFPWRADESGLHAWTKGMTGYPLVDAGMRELWATGWMHNRVRMVTASFLVKHLLVPWQRGEEWFWDTLVDADLANNTANWQWVAGCGADAAPYFRIFNPIAQGEKFDPSGAYVRKWVPEIAGLPDAYVHKPWQAPSEVLNTAGIVVGETYPAPIVEHGQARTRALEAYQQIRTKVA